MKKAKLEATLLCCESSFDELCMLESIIKFTKDACYKQECCSNYYSLLGNDKWTLSTERNHYINMLEIALDKVIHLKEINQAIENEIAGL